MLILLISLFLVIFPLFCAYLFYRSHKVKRIITNGREFSEKNVLKNGFSENKVKGVKFDCIVIGSGIGGLTVSNALTLIGKKVLLLEQHDIIGGCTHSFTEKGFEFDTGLHYIGKDASLPNTLLGYLFEFLGSGSIKWSNMDKVYDKAIISKSLGLDEEQLCPEVSFSSDHNEMIDFLSSKFPNEVENIKNYFYLVGWAAEIVFPLYIFLKILPSWISVLFEYLLGPIFRALIGNTSLNVMKSITKNSELIGILHWCWPDYGLTPMESSFTINALLTKHFENGAVYPTGGVSTIARSFLKILISNGGMALVRAPVSSILLDSSETKAIGVTVRGVEIYAPIVVSSVGIINTYTKLLPSNCSNKHVKNVRSNLSLEVNQITADLKPSLSMFTVFVGLKGNSEELKLPRTNLWLFPSWNHDESLVRFQKSLNVFCSLNKVPSGKDIDKFVPFLPCVFIASPSAKDDNWNERFPQKSTLEIISIADFDSFLAATPLSKLDKPMHRGGRYEVLKAVMEKRLMQVLLDHFPHLKDNIELVISGTPMTNRFYLGAMKGEVYGLAHSPSRFIKHSHLTRPKQNISGLYLAGQDVVSDGIAGALMGGIACAISVNPFVFIDLLISYFVK